MSDLPNPITSEGQQPNPVQAVPPAQQIAPSADPKLFKEQTIQQLEAVIAQTTSDPSERAAYVHQLKADFIKAQYGIDVKEKA